MDVGAMAQQAAMGDGGMSQQAAREVSVLLSANTGPFNKEMEKAASATNDLADALHRVEKAYVGVLKFIGKGMIGIGASMQATATGAVWTAAQFEESFARVAKTTGLENELFGATGNLANFGATLGLGDNALQQFENDIRALSTQIPVAVQELSYLADVAGTLGVESDNLALFAETAAKLGAGINELGSDQAIAGLANLIGAFGDAEDTVVNLGSALAELSNNTRGNAAEMLQFSDRLAGTAVQVGMTAEEVLGLGAAISAIGVMPELGASAMVQVITRFSQAVQRGGDDLAKFAQAMNLTKEELTTMWQDQGATQVIVHFLQRLSDQGEEASLTLERLGLSGVNITQVFGGLAAQMHVVRESLDISKEANEAGEAVDELAGIRFDTVIMALRQFRQSTTEVFRSMGQAFLVPVKMIIDGMTSLVNLFNILPQPMKTIIGLVAGLGGAALTAAGAFTLFFASFHGFFMILHTIPILLAGVQKALIGIAGAQGAAAATTSIQRLINVFTGFASFLTDIPGTIGRAFTALGAHLVTFGTALRNMVVAGMVASRAATVALATALKTVLVSSAGIATAALGKLGVALRFVTTLTVAETIGAMGTAIRSMGFASGMALKALIPLTAALAKVLGPIIAIGGAIWWLIDGKRAWAEATEEQTSKLAELADNANLALSGIQQLSDVIVDPTIGTDLQFEASDLLDTLARLDERETKDYLFLYGMQLLAGGSEPEAVRRHIEELAELAGTPIIFPYDIRDLRSGEGFRDAAERLEEAFSRAGQAFDPSDEGWFSRAWNWMRDRPSPTQQAAFTDQLAQTSVVANLMPEEDIAGRIALYHQAMQDIERGLDEGDITRNQAAWLREQIEELELIPETLQDMVDPIPLGIRWFWTDVPDVPSAQEFLAAAIEDEDFADVMGMPDIQELLEEELPIPGWFSNVVGDTLRIKDSDLPDFAHDWGLEGATHEVNIFAEAIRNIDPDAFDRISEKLIDLQVDFNDAAAVAGMMSNDFANAIEEAFFTASAMSDDIEAGRFLDFFFEQHPRDVGYAQAIADAEAELQRLIDAKEIWGDDADRLRRVLATWGEEHARMQIRDLEQELNAMGAVEQVIRLQQELRGLDTSTISGRIMGEQITDRLNQAMVQAQNEFRSLMDQRDRLIEQRENAEENHQRRVERMKEDHHRRMNRMEEDYNRSVQDAHDSHKKRLEDIAKAEKDALENRAEQQARAFNIMQRIQAVPTAEIGAVTINMAQQNEAMEQMVEDIARLRSMGLDEDLMVELGFTDPKNFAVVQRLLHGALADPGLIDEINAEWERRVDISQAFVQEVDAAEITEQFDQQRKDAEERLDEQLQRMQERYERQVADANENHQRQLDDAAENLERQVKDIGEALAKLGQDTAKTIDELIAEGLDSGIEGIKARAKELQRAMELVDPSDTWEHRVGTEPVDTSDSWEHLVEREARRVQDTNRRVKEDTEETTGKITSTYDAAIRNWHNILTGQDPMWSASTSQAERGAGRLIGSVTGTLSDGTSRIDGIMRDWTSSIEDGLNPVLQSIGEEPLNITVTSSSSRSSGPGGSGGGGERFLADGGFLPDRAEIRPPGTVVQWAEPETGGEAFIPLAPSKRQRSTEIWEKTGRLLGVEFREGGFLDVPDLSDLGTIGETSESAISFTNDAVQNFLDSLGVSSRSLDTDTTPRSGQYGGVMPWVAWSGNVVNARFGPMPGGIGGVGPRSGPSDHPTGHALDFMVGDNSRGHALGDRISAFLRRNWVDHAVKYLIWKQRITHGSTWRDMATRGNRTADHWDHPHVSYNPRPGPGYGGPMPDAEPAREAGLTPGIAREDNPSSGSAGGTELVVADGGIIERERIVFADGGVRDEKDHAHQMMATADSVPAWVTEGEYVVRKEAVDHYGTKMLHDINAERYAQGGRVGGGEVRGRERHSDSGDLVKAFTTALQQIDFGHSEENNWGPITVQAQDTKQMIRELERKQRLNRLTNRHHDG